jgi:hypothetical protein
MLHQSKDLKQVKGRYRRTRDGRVDRQQVRVLQQTLQKYHTPIKIKIERYSYSPNAKINEEGNRVKRNSHGKTLSTLKCITVWS